MAAQEIQRHHDPQQIHCLTERGVGVEVEEVN